jgi:hypothetical protein
MLPSEREWPSATAYSFAFTQMSSRRVYDPFALTFRVGLTAPVILHLLLKYLQL